MNNWNGIGRATKDPTVNTGADGKITVARFTLACDRRYKKEGEEQTADYIPVVAFGRSAEFVSNYVKKGMKLGVFAHVQTGSYTNKEGQKVYTTDFVADQIEFCESKRAAAPSTEGAAPTAADEGEFLPLPEGVEEELPFN